MSSRAGIYPAPRAPVFKDIVIWGRLPRCVRLVRSAGIFYVLSWLPCRGCAFMTTQSWLYSHDYPAERAALSCVHRHDYTLLNFIVVAALSWLHSRGCVVMTAQSWPRSELHSRGCTVVTEHSWLHSRDWTLLASVMATCTVMAIRTVFATQSWRQ